jgi:hypothetical protein
MERRRNSPETAENVARMLAEEKFHRQLPKLARQAITEFGWGIERWLAECRAAWEWEWREHKKRLCKERSAPLRQAIQAEEQAEGRWQAQQKTIAHQEKLGRAREARRKEKGTSG